VSAGPTVIPLAGAAGLRPLARRTLRLRLLAAALLLAAAVVAVLVSLGRPATTGAYLPRGRTGVVVLDVSASISSDTYARIAATLGRLASSGGHSGLILFSDTAYQALPPGTPDTELTPFRRFFDVRSQSTPGLLPELPRSPWTDAFSAGTRISTGLQLALDTIQRERIQQPSILLVSDLDDDTEDLERLTSVGLALRRLGIPLRVVGLNPAPEDEQFFRRLVPRPGDIVQARLPGQRDPGASAPFPTGIVVATVAVALLLGLFLVAGDRLRWRTA